MSGPSKEPAQKPADPANSLPAGAAADPTMEDILASIRRILNDEGTSADPTERREEVLVLDDSMMVADPNPATALVAHQPLVGPSRGVGSAPANEEATPSDQIAGGRLVAPEAAAAAAAAVGGLVKRLTSERGAAVHRGGPTIEDLVREELRPLLKAWLDANLPALVERVVRAEIERVLGRAAG
ncbi:MAG: DUF2497 domain-containing protein [Acetobacteraceae bacterium]